MHALQIFMIEYYYAISVRYSSAHLVGYSTGMNVTEGVYYWRGYKTGCVVILINYIHLQSIIDN